MIISFLIVGITFFIIGFTAGWINGYSDRDKIKTDISEKNELGRPFNYYDMISTKDLEKMDAISKESTYKILKELEQFEKQSRKSKLRISKK